MEQTKKVPFFIKVKNAIFNFDKYQFFAGEKVISAIKYILKIIIIFSIILTAIIMYKVVQESNKLIKEFEANAPEFKFENNTLIIEGENKHFVKEDKSGYFTLVMNSEKENVSDIENFSYANVVAFLKDKIILNYNNTQKSILYSQISEEYDINNITKANLLEVINQKGITKIYIIIVATILISAFVVYTIQVFLDILLLSIIGIIISKIIKIKFKYEMIFNISVYSITLPVILLYIYICINILTGFTIKYFETAYNSIAYIYIITAMFMIKSDLIKQQIEVAKIVEEQKKVREEHEEEKEEKNQEKSPEEQKDNKKEKEKKETKPKGDVEGSKA